MISLEGLNEMREREREREAFKPEVENEIKMFFKLIIFNCFNFP